MENLIIKSTPEMHYYPEINFNRESGICYITGESYMEDVFSFYEKIIKWLEEFIATKPPLITLNIQLQYFNTTTSRCILEILGMLHDFQQKGGNVTVNWHYDKEDIAVIDDIKDMEIEAGLKINMFGE